VLVERPSDGRGVRRSTTALRNVNITTSANIVALLGKFHCISTQQSLIIRTSLCNCSPICTHHYDRYALTSLVIALAAFELGRRPTEIMLSEVKVSPLHWTWRIGTDENRQKMLGWLAGIVIVSLLKVRKQACNLSGEHDTLFACSVCGLSVNICCMQGTHGHTLAEYAFPGC
jgi:hypothetical protein